LNDFYHSYFFKNQPKVRCILAEFFRCASPHYTKNKFYKFVFADNFSKSDYTLFKFSLNGAIMSDTISLAFSVWHHYLKQLTEKHQISLPIFPERRKTLPCSKGI